MIVTTSYDPSPVLVREANAFSRKWGWRYSERKNDTVPKIKKRHGVHDVIVLSEYTATWYAKQSTFKFHPSLAVIRIKNMINGGVDVLQHVAKLGSGDTFLDTTLGFGADAVTASHIVGDEGKVDGLESVSAIAAVTSYGLSHFWVDNNDVVNAMRRVRVCATDYLSYFRQCPDNAYDVIYFDPMFPIPLKRSVNMAPLWSLADHSLLTEEAIEHARRIARKRVVMKGLITDTQFERFNFTMIKRNRMMGYGILEVGK